MLQATVSKLTKAPFTLLEIGSETVPTVPSKLTLSVNAASELEKS
jgi:hypothetical protein